MKLNRLTLVTTAGTEPYAHLMPHIRLLIVSDSEVLYLT